VPGIVLEISVEFAQGNWSRGDHLQANQIDLDMDIAHQITLSAQEEEAKASGLALNTKPMLRI
jgi:hypothetical protein